MVIYPNAFIATIKFPISEKLVMIEVDELAKAVSLSLVELANVVAFLAIDLPSVSVQFFAFELAFFDAGVADELLDTINWTNTFPLLLKFRIFPICWIVTEMRLHFLEYRVLQWDVRYFFVDIQQQLLQLGHILSLPLHASQLDPELFSLQLFLFFADFLEDRLLFLFFGELHFDYFSLLLLEFFFQFFELLPIRPEQQVVCSLDLLELLFFALDFFLGDFDFQLLRDQLLFDF